MKHKLVVAEKPSVALSISKVLGATKNRTDIMKETDTGFLGVWDT